MKKILIIIQRSNGDVLLASPLINQLYEHYNNPHIDLLINDDTYTTAKTLQSIHRFHFYSYTWKKKGLWYRIKKEYQLIKAIYKHYDLSITLTASDRSTLYALLSSSYPIGTIEKESKKSWWKRWLLKKSYYFNAQRHIIHHTIEPLNCLGITPKKVIPTCQYTHKAKQTIQQRLQDNQITHYILFHPCAQYNYKVYPKALRDQLLIQLNALNIPIIVTGSPSPLDQTIKQEIPKLPNIYNFIGTTSLEEYIVLSDLSQCYIGMDTLNMHIAASQNKRIFAIFGPTNVSTWSPWSNHLQHGTTTNALKQTYDTITLFQADLPCIGCGLAGCDDQHGLSECLFHIDPHTIYNEVKSWLTNSVPLYSQKTQKKPSVSVSTH